MPLKCDQDNQPMQTTGRDERSLINSAKTLSPAPFPASSGYVATSAAPLWESAGGVFHRGRVYPKGLADERPPLRREFDQTHVPVVSIRSSRKHPLLPPVDRDADRSRREPTFGPIVLTGNGPLWSSTSSTPKSEPPRAARLTYRLSVARAVRV
jgi:hypothetical protein